MSYKSDLLKADRITESADFPAVILIDNCSACNLQCSMCDHKNIRKYHKVAEIMGTEHYEHRISAIDFATHMHEILNALGEPFLGAVSTFFLSILMKNHVKVALSSDGDEFNGGYLSHPLAFPIEIYLDLRALGIDGWKDLDGASKKALCPFDSPKQFRFLQSVASRDIADWRGRLSVFSHSERALFLKKSVLHAAGHPHIEDIYERTVLQLRAKDVLNKSLEINQKELLPNQVLTFVDRLSMAHSIEVRAPYLDYRIIEFTNRLPGNLKIRNGTNKYIHKKAVEELLPADSVNRPKEGFVQPIYPWMHGVLRDWVEEQLDSLSSEFFNLDYVKDLRHRFQAADQGKNAKVWNLVCFSLWYQGWGSY